jgi:hypothetical protein
MAMISHKHFFSSNIFQRLLKPNKHETHMLLL